MIRPGFETTDPFTNTRLVVIKGAEETDGRGWVIEVHCPQGAPPAIQEHIHLTWSETFEILQGSATYKLGGKEHAINTGESVLMPPAVPHIHPWNTGSGMMVYRQTNDFSEADPTAVHDVLGVFATINGLAREGKIGWKGLPKNPLQMGASVRALTRHGGFDANMPIPMQRALSATLGRLAEALGYRGVYPRYVGDAR